VMPLEDLYLYFLCEISLQCSVAHTNITIFEMIEVLFQPSRFVGLPDWAAVIVVMLVALYMYVHILYSYKSFYLFYFLMFNGKPSLLTATEHGRTHFFWIVASAAQSHGR
jgi:hypothetical protein